MKKMLLAFLLVGFMPLFYCQTASLKEQKIRELLSIMGENERYVQMQKSMIDAICKSNPRVKKETLTEMASQINPKEIVELVIPIYEKYYSVEDIDQIIAFYKSPTGQKILQVIPKLMQETMEVVIKWSQEKTQEILKKMEVKNKDKL
jgi:hypothetical protein